MTNKELLEEIKKLKSIAEVGLLYSQNGYDKERYAELQNMAFRIMGKVSGYNPGALQKIYPLPVDYPTAKVDIRGLILSDDSTKVLLVKESIDGKWSLPGGWADIGYTPGETVIKECKEETGLDIIPERLLAVFDTKMHAHPPEPLYVYKMIFYCRTLSAQLAKGFDILDAGYFEIDNLPPLSENRILKSQILLLHKRIMASEHETWFD